MFCCLVLSSSLVGEQNQFVHRPTHNQLQVEKCQQEKCCRPFPAAMLSKAKAKAATKASRGQRANEKREMDQALNRTQDEIEKSLREADAG